MGVLCAWFSFFPPEAGLAISFLVGFAAIFALATLSKWQKFLFAVFTMVFVFTEIRAISRDYNERKASIDTMLARLKESIDTIAGTNAFPYVVPQPFFGDNIPLVIWNAGEYPLIGVTVTIMNKSAFGNGTGEFGGSELDVGVLPPHGHRALKYLISPKPDATGEDVYIIYISAQNGFVSQILKFRKSKPRGSWAYFYAADKGSDRFGPTSPPKVANSDTQSISTGVWSDDPEFGKTAPIQKQAK